MSIGTSRDGVIEAQTVLSRIGAASLHAINSWGAPTKGILKPHGWRADAPDERIEQAVEQQSLAVMERNQLARSEQASHKAGCDQVSEGVLEAARRVDGVALLVLLGEHQAGRACRNNAAKDSGQPPLSKPTMACRATPPAELGRGNPTAPGADLSRNSSAPRMPVYKSKQASQMSYASGCSIVNCPLLQVQHEPVPVAPCPHKSQDTREQADKRSK
eukprot:CAMPEP_0170429576 /NCGR_PEP_ID=MMETSP0117_2-20130122/40385_1 /TAXON_ID=400756 /ORGANISM="Durinskia baltica, Strain CSIRO CS-38" /LENGTH=216 /DNA_ID=CAMNT_0010688961 /DNA_START=66 /DNA_END=713 /DNA_ORIENTATION=+